MNFAGIAVLTEPDASRAPRIIGCIRCTGGRGGVTHLLATIAISHPLAKPSQREKSLRFSARSDIPLGRIARTVTATRSSFSCRLIDDTSFYELSPPSTVGATLRGSLSVETNRRPVTMMSIFNLKCDSSSLSLYRCSGLRNFSIIKKKKLMLLKNSRNIFIYTFFGKLGYLIGSRAIFAREV